MKGAEGAEKRWGPKACTHHSLTHPCGTYLEPREKAEEQKGGVGPGAENERKEPKSASHLHALNQPRKQDGSEGKKTHLSTKGSSFPGLPPPLPTKKRKEKVQTQPQNIWRMRGEQRRWDKKEREREKRKWCGLMTGRLLVAREENEETGSDLQWEFRWQEHAMQSLYGAHNWRKSPWLEVGSKEQEGKGRPQKAEYFPPQITCGSHVTIKRERKKGDSGLGLGEEEEGVGRHGEKRKSSPEISVAHSN